MNWQTDNNFLYGNDNLVLNYSVRFKSDNFDILKKYFVHQTILLPNNYNLKLFDNQTILRSK